MLQLRTVGIRVRMVGMDMKQDLTKVFDKVLLLSGLPLFQLPVQLFYFMSVDQALEQPDQEIHHNHDDMNDPVFDTAK